MPERPRGGQPSRAPPSLVIERTTDRLPDGTRHYFGLFSLFRSVFRDGWTRLGSPGILG
jgi:hypothetical protein